MRVYLDSAPLIYLVENIAPYASALTMRLAQPGTTQVCSDLSRLECRVKPMRDGETALLTAFDSYFTGVISEVIPLTRPVVDLAAAIISGCDLFLTNDYHLDKCAEITVEVVAP